MTGTLRITRGALGVLCVVLGGAAFWSFRAYQEKASLQRSGLSSLEREKASQLLRQIADAREQLKQAHRPDVEAARPSLEIRKQLERLAALSRESHAISRIAGLKALGGVWMGFGFLI